MKIKDARALASTEFRSTRTRKQFLQTTYNKTAAQSQEFTALFSPHILEIQSDMRTYVQSSVANLVSSTHATWRLSQVQSPRDSLACFFSLFSYIYIPSHFFPPFLRFSPLLCAPRAISFPLPYTLLSFVSSCRARARAELCARARVDKAGERVAALNLPFFFI